MIWQIKNRKRGHIYDLSTGVEKKFKGETLGENIYFSFYSFDDKNIIIKLSECDLTYINIIIHVCYKAVISTFEIFPL